MSSTQRYFYVTLSTTALGTTDGLYASDGTYNGTMLLKAAGTGFLPGYQMAALPNGKVVFGALLNNPSDPFGSMIGGDWLWVTDGTVAGTTVISAFPDQAFGRPNDASGFSGFVTFGTKVLFEVNDGFGNYDLYSTDGVQGGTHQLALPVAATSVGVGDGASTGTKFIYTTLGTTAAGTVDGLYATDGTYAGTTLIKAAGTGFLPGYQMAALPNGKVVFGALLNNSSDPLGSVIGDDQLWVTDGTAVGTTMISTFPDQAFGRPNDASGFSGFVTFGTKVLYELNDGFGDYYLFATDGTQAGTQQLASPVAATSVGVGDGASTGTKFIYTTLGTTAAGTPAGLYATDGTTAGTTLIKAAGTGFLPGYQMAALPNGEVVFGALRNTPLDPLGAMIGGVQLWETNGTAAGTTMISTYPDQNFGHANDTAGLSNFVTVGGEVYFEYADGLGDFFLYATDGTRVGTVGLAAPVAATSVGVGDGAPTPCYAAGTRIATPRGLVAVEGLRVGDAVLTAGGEARPVVWLGWRSVACARHPRPETVWPVRVRRHAFGPDTPCRDLFLSPDHAVFTGGVLIPVRYLVNGASIAQEARDAITYWHVELATHDVILAEGLACESYLDTGNRWAFAGGGPALLLHPDFALRVWETGACAPLVTHGPRLHDARARLLERLPALGVVLTDRPDLRFFADDTRELEPQADGDRLWLALPDGAATLRLASRHAVPAERDPAGTDCRRLGVALTQLRLDDTPVPLDDARFVAGWHAPELGLRWTNGAGLLDVGGASVVELRFAAPALRYTVPARADCTMAA